MTKHTNNLGYSHSHEGSPDGASPLGASHCQDLLGNLSDFIDGTLKDELCGQIQKHLEECENCRIVVDTLRKTVYLYHAAAAEVPPVPEKVRERLYHSLALDEFLKKS